MDGAGASKAVMGELCPTMNEAVNQVGIDKLLKGITLQTKSNNLEDIYSELYKRGDECKEARIAMEESLYKYFSDIYLPFNRLTIYDQLILSLTNKDCIISFNWDSLLIQAYNRVDRISTNKPEMFFLHGNVGAGFCEGCKRLGPLQNNYPACGNAFKPVPLLYPADQKDYNSNIFIRDQWVGAKDYISRAVRVTFFGYSAPSSDKEASNILKATFSQINDVHKYDEIEIIERSGFNSKEISETWKFFIELTHGRYGIVDSFYDSELAQATRWTLESQFKRFFENWWGKPRICFTQHETFESVSALLKPLLDNETKEDYSVI